MEVYSQLVESLENCDALCNNCVTSSLDEDNIQPLSACIKLSIDCADICHLALKLLTRDSSHTVSAVELCMTICGECAAECEKHDYDQCRLSTRACRQCESHCRIYLEQVAEPDTT